MYFIHIIKLNKYKLKVIGENVIIYACKYVLKKARHATMYARKL